ncbi:conserved Plasmodium protein, unknown function [Plasmodium berghei]|uniref:Uncharacterized protein n=3 Tax=Plasmodium berghei TaxID=5821 RepID=A0A509ARK7_PLABA|nr:conserved Plasmodium protein, unknown function [Plasmodium berghei ANKA]SCM27076.1 conserved Plasmodium protein, unknown function [Plasmodium berghei]SCN28802.1 conserved Plasmodium protein, unknown function [Plasmodium berghei]SCO63095.1 conserved Plasmodium protein, unknown function [Plasmodium berghei]SCO64549.1 conserved Plasmodium protein, unknown function [Plasmodium berghei]VUC58685.1 conserved Plasmodium protein, unknown function [Plasmodium berghei ANKA]|eukprot:XP_034424448.1 conserved Plasmodium protein, unknown function [Plasmodium berghei ANKA]
MKIYKMDNEQIELRKLLKKLKKKKIGLPFKYENNGIFDIKSDEKEFDDYINDIDSDNNIKKYKDVYNNFENNINDYFSEYTERIICSSINRNFKIHNKKTEEIFSTPFDTIYQEFNYGTLRTQKLRDYENREKYFTSPLSEIESEYIIIKY